MRDNDSRKNKLKAVTMIIIVVTTNNNCNNTNDDNITNNNRYWNYKNNDYKYDNFIAGYIDRKNIYISQKTGAEMSILVRLSTVRSFFYHELWICLNVPYCLVHFHCYIIKFVLVYLFPMHTFYMFIHIFVFDTYLSIRINTDLFFTFSYSIIRWKWVVNRVCGCASCKKDFWHIQVNILWFYILICCNFSSRYLTTLIWYFC